MAEKTDIKAVLANVVMRQDGKVITAPKSGHVATQPIEGSALVAMPGHEVTKVLTAAFPRCVFTWFAKPAPAAAGSKG